MIKVLLKRAYNKVLGNKIQNNCETKLTWVTTVKGIFMKEECG